MPIDENFKRIGAGIWWLSGKTSYQTSLLAVLQNFQGDKYAQLIGRSDQTDRFKDNNIVTPFMQAKQLGIRYIEPWIYEYQNNTMDGIGRFLPVSGNSAILSR